MVPNTPRPLRIVQTIPGETTGTDNDRYVASDGSVWKKVDPWQSTSTQTASGVTRQLYNGWLLP